ncbi:MAG TPA: M56 family metallopeptidase [Gemmatimonadaceae bacterium]|nr:M56 family metallopeptidase [Gemmatimonadaceae bacterium]
MTTEGWLRLVAAALLHLLWQGAAVALLLGAALRVTRGAAAVVHYRLALGGLALLVALPLFTAAMLAQELGVIAAGRLTGVPLLPAVTPQAALRLGREAAASAAPLLGPWLRWLAVAWLAGLVVGAVRLGRDAHRLRAAVRAALAPAAPVDAGRWARALQRARRALPVRAPVALAAADVDSPLVLGWRRPVLLVPARLGARLSGAEAELLVAHELAHVRRGDYVVNLLQLAAETLLFFHPAVWWASRRARAAREACCDTLVVERYGDAAAYVRALLHLEEGRAAPLRLAPAGAGGDLLDRARRLLAPAPRPGRHRPRGVRLAAAGAGALLGVAAAGEGALVARATAPLFAAPPAALAALGMRDMPYTVTARDDAGRFTVTLLNGRAVDATVNHARLAPAHLRHAGDSLFLLAPHGARLVGVRILPDGELRWAGRPSRHAAVDPTLP